MNSSLNLIEREKEPNIAVPKNSKIREYFASKPEKFKSIVDLTKEKAQIAKKNQSYRQKLVNPPLPVLLPASLQ